MNLKTEIYDFNDAILADLARRARDGEPLIPNPPDPDRAPHGQGMTPREFADWWNTKTSSLEVR